MKSESDMPEYSAFSVALKKVLQVPSSEMHSRIAEDKKHRRKTKRVSRVSRAKD